MTGGQIYWLRMADRPPSNANKDDRVRIGRRGFIGAGLAGAGAALIAPATAPAAARASSAASAGAAGAGAQGTAAPVARTAASQIARLPLQSTYPHLPAIPSDPVGVIDALARLALRTQQLSQAKQGLTNTYKIGGRTDVAYSFLFGATDNALGSADAQALTSLLQTDPNKTLTRLIQKPPSNGLGSPPTASRTSNATGKSLERPEQFSIAWTTFPNVYRSALSSLPVWASSLKDADAASEQFWPMIAGHGFAYNLIILDKVTRQRARTVRRHFDEIWNPELERAAAAENLFVIDMSRFQALQPQSVHGAARFTPSTVTLLRQDPRTKALTPIAITVSGYRGRSRRMYTRANSTDGAWLYALQAAKTSISVYGVWLGHVYQWHIVTCAMQMTTLNTLPTSHPVYQLLAPQSNFAIPFDDVLLALWPQVAPPTSLTSAADFLELADDFAAGRSFFDDDPRATLSRLGLVQADFTRKRAWDQYPVVRRLLAVWDLVADYVRSFVQATYRSDSSVAADGDLQRWIAASSASSQGNIRGLPRMNSRAALQRVLTSLLYRVVVHGISRMNSTANPALTFVANFPHCLQRTDIPSPRTRISTKRLLTYLPNTETIGEAVNFYFTFVFSPPYAPLIPIGGVNTQLFFPGGVGDRRNQALIKLRRGMVAFINDYEPQTPQRFQWPLNIET